jgi:XTP/dITP diphosphohydrolase
VNRLLLATRNAHKIGEIKAIMTAGGVTSEIVSLEEAHVPWSSREDGIEAFDSFQSNARAKAEYFSKLTALPTLADDSGIEVLSLMGDPGVRSKRFAPTAAALTGAELDQANNAELLRRLLGAGEKRRRASYTCVAVLLRRPGAVAESFTGHCWGRILEEPKGTGGFGYDPLFYFEELEKTFAELTMEEKNAVSHRGEAFRHVAAALAAKPLV